MFHHLASVSGLMNPEILKGSGKITFCIANIYDSKGIKQ